MKFLLSLFAVAVVLGVASPKAEAHDRRYKQRSHSNYCPPPRDYCPPVRSYSRSYCPPERSYRSNYRPSRSYSAPCPPPRRYHRSSGFSVTIVR